MLVKNAQPLLLSTGTTVVEYWNHRDEISELDGILFKGEKIIVPHTLRQDMLKLIHTRHIGMEKCNQRAKDILFWPGKRVNGRGLLHMLRAPQL
jgi:hypothetical protein